MDVPDPSGFVLDDSMLFANEKMASFRVIFAERIARLGGENIPIFGNSLVLIPSAGINVRVIDVSRIVEISYPFAEQGLTVNVLTLQNTTANQLVVERIRSSHFMVVALVSGIKVYLVQAAPSTGPTNAYVAISGSDLYYAEGHDFAHQMLAYTLDLRVNGDGSYARTDLLKKAYLLLTQGITNIVGYSYTPNVQKSNGVAMVLKVVALDPDQVESRQVLVFESQSAFSTNVDSARDTFLNKNEQACYAGQYVVGSERLPLSSLRSAIQGL
jgi:hypothetical protein